MRELASEFFRQVPAAEVRRERIRQEAPRYAAAFIIGMLLGWWLL